jgi:alkanesulfonate monooxygenase SsuD/methylene tetrahydromethanopterin reductase-like flavin-dependent oxidoreductase (luciferase family)
MGSGLRREAMLRATSGRRIMRFGLFGGAAARRGLAAAESARGYHDFVEYHVEAEALGFHGSFVTEHHFTGIGQISATLDLLTWIAARTSTLRLGTAVLVLPWHNPVLLAEQAATLDLLSGGRLDLGVGKGYRHNEFSGFRMAPEEAAPRFDEALEVIRRAFVANEPFSHRGRFWSFADILVEPPPAQRPHPPLWMAASSTGSLRDCARRGCSLLLDQFAAPAQHAERIALYRQELAAAGHDPAAAQVAVARNFWVASDADDRELALERQAAAHRRLLDLSRGTASRPGSHILGYSDHPGAREEHALIGTPDEIADKLDALRRCGIDYVLLSGQGSRDNLRRFARDIMPGFAD